MKGVLVDICKRLEEITGLKLTYLPNDDMNRIIDSSVVSYHTLYYEGKEILQNKNTVTNSVLDQPFRMYHRIGDIYESNKPYKIAVFRNRDGILEYLQKEYPLCTVQEYDSPELCMKQVYKGKTDLTFLDTHIAENVLVSESLNGITSVPFTEITMGIALEFHSNDAETLCKIINKGVHLLGDKIENDSMLKYAQNTYPKRIFRFFIQQHFAASIVILIIIIVIILVYSILIIYARVLMNDRNRVMKINEERSDFFARMSHDLKNPMNGILGMIELSEKTNDVIEIKENLYKAKNSGKYMLSLINDILDMRRIETNKFKLETDIVYLKEFIENIADMIEPSAKLKKQSFVIDTENFNTDRYIKTDELRLKQVFVNILSNAVKFTNEEGSVKLTFKTIKSKGNIESEKIIFEDTGVGISQDFLKHKLFKAYSQEKNSITEQTAGSGLGLAISKNIIELMGGHIEAESELGKGTTFTVYINFNFVNKLKVEKQDSLDKKEVLSFSKKLEGLHVLICEDQEINAEIIKRILEKKGCIVSIANNGKEGLLVFQNSNVGEYNVIIMDMRMPIMSGPEATRAIRSLEREDAKSIPIIAMTANAYEEDRKECLESGMNEHLAKPIETMKLYETIINCLERK